MIIMDCNQGTFIRATWRVSWGGETKWAIRLQTAPEQVEKHSALSSLLRNQCCIDHRGYLGECYRLWSTSTPQKAQWCTCRHYSTPSWWVLAPPLVLPDRRWLMVIGKPPAGQLYVWLCAGPQINITNNINTTTYISRPAAATNKDNRREKDGTESDCSPYTQAQTLYQHYY